MTSKTNPFTNVPVEPDDAREASCVLLSGRVVVLDRDYLGALNIARCVEGGSARSSPVVSWSGVTGASFVRARGAMVSGI